LSTCSPYYAENVIRSPTARLFVAVDPPEDVCERLTAWAREGTRGAQAREQTKTSVRVLDAELLHVTLCFLGNRPAGEMDVLASELSTCDGRSGELSLGAPLWLPERNPRALAVELYDEQGQLAALQAEVVDALERVSGWQPNGSAHTGVKATSSRRRFRPHVTVARLRGSEAPRQRALPPTPSASFSPREMVLYRSWLSPEGASYEAVAAYPIG
jgi:RNA 2',3'-cyclic 3'-phosphodiesterase